MSSEKHNIDSFAIVLDEKGGIKENILPEKVTKETNFVWINLDSAQTEEKISLLKKLPFIDENIKHAYNSPITRNKLIVNEFQDCFYINFYGTYSPKNTINMKLIFTKNMIITIENAPLKSLNYTFEDLKIGNGPKSISELFLKITQNLFDLVYEKTSQISENIDSLETKTIEAKHTKEFDDKIYKLRKDLINIHRYIIPQRSVFQDILDLNNFFAETKQKTRLKEVIETVESIITNSEYSREHIVALKEELQNNLSININNNMYIITLLVAIFTPISLIIDLIGVDLSVVFKETDFALALVGGVVGVISLIMFFIVKKLRLK